MGRKPLSINWDDIFKPTAPAPPVDKQVGPVNWDDVFQPQLKPTREQELRQQPPEPGKIESFLSKYIASPIAGAVQGLTGLNPRIGKVKYPHVSAMSPGAQQEFIPLPESKTLRSLGGAIGTLGGLAGLENIARQGAIKLFGKGAFEVGLQAAKALPRRQQLKLLTPLATAIGAQTGIRESVNQIFEKGYLDPKVVGEEAATSAALTYVFPAAAEVFGKSLRYAVTKAIPELSRALPGALGGPGVMGAREVSQQMLERFRPLSLPRVAFQHIADFAQNPRWGEGMNRFGRGIEAFIRGIAYQAETPVSRFKDVAGQETALNAPRLFMMAEQTPRYVRLPETTEEVVTTTGTLTRAVKGRVINEGGGLWGKLWKNEAADQLEKEYTRLQGTPYKRMAWVLKTAAGIMRRDVVSPRMLERFTARIEAALAEGPYQSKIRGIYGTTFKLTKPGEFLVYLKEMAILQKERGSWYRGVESFVRRGISHIQLGMGNVASAVTMLSRLNIPLTSDGPEAVAAGLNEIRDNTDFYQRVLKAVGVTEPVRGLGVEEPSKLGAASFSLYRKTEQIIMPLVAMARYYKSRAAGATYADALSEGLNAVRQVRTALDYDIPALLRRGGAVGSALRIAFQYFPFALKSTQFASSLGLGQFMEYVGWTTSIAGLKGIPFATSLDRIVGAATGVSILNSYMSDPDFLEVTRGIPGIAAGIDIGSRHNWSQALVDRLISPEQGPALNYERTLADALAAFERRQDGYTAIQLFKAALPMEARYLFNALDAEKHGALLDQRGFPIAKRPTDEELGTTALGFQPLRVSQERALQAEAAVSKAPRTRDVQVLETEYRRAIQENNQEEIQRVASELRKYGLKTRDLVRLRKEVMREPSERIIRRLPRQLRPKLQDLKRRIIESQRE